MLSKEFFIKIAAVYICLGVDKKIRLWIFIRLIGEWVMSPHPFFKTYLDVPQQDVVIDMLI